MSTEDSGNVFEKVLTSAGDVEKALLGPSYSYSDNIKSPSEIGMSSEGSMKALGNDITGLVSYVELLVTGKSVASKTGGPLGNKFFLQTGVKCNNLNADGNPESRFIYINNVPNGDIPFISSVSGVNFTEFEGLIPGVMGNLAAFNPFTIMQAFLSGGTPDCQAVTLEVIDEHNSKSMETHFVSIVDLNNMNACDFPDRKNPITKKECRQAFTNMEEIDKTHKPFMIFLAIIGLLILFGILKFLR